MSTPKIIPRIFGGLGNQLFIYAAARRLALINNAELVLDDVSGFVRDHRYERHCQLAHFHIPCRIATAVERLEPAARLRRYLKRRINERRPFMERRFIQQEGVNFDPRLLRVKPRGTLHLEGYWQSEGYFKDVETAIRQDLTIEPPNDVVNLAMADHIRTCTAVAVHVRFFDAPQIMDVNNTPSDYYSCAIAEMERRVPYAHYFLFSDRPEAARACVSLPDERITLVSHNLGDTHAFADLWLMTLCQHFIIANSTFSWWGAWLSDSLSKIVIAPGKYSPENTTWGFDGLIPDSWVQIQPNK